MSPFLRSASGHSISLLEPRNSNFSIDDIARGLSNSCRFSGQCGRFYSVAQHSILVASLCPEYLQFPALMHDASEAYICDIPSPLKALLSQYQEIEAKVQAAIEDQFGITLTQQDRSLIKVADKIALVVERHIVNSELIDVSDLLERWDEFATGCRVDSEIMRRILLHPSVNLPDLSSLTCESAFLATYAELEGDFSKNNHLQHPRPFTA